MLDDEPLVPDWETEGLLGEGGMGRVFRARRRSDAREAALKVVRPRSGATVPDAYRRRFLRETAVMRGLDHPGLPGFIDAGVTARGLPWLAVELLEGTTLEDAPGYGCMTPQALVPRLRELLATLSHLHGLGLVHRDVKPANVFLCPDRTVLLDLGLVFVEEGTRLTATGDVAGTLSTMAPEILRGEPATAATDLYGLAATAWMALLGAPPRDSDVLVALATRVPEPVPLAAATGHAGLDVFLAACLEAAPTDRPPTAAAASGLLALDRTLETVPGARSHGGRKAAGSRAAAARTSTVRARPVAAPTPPAPAAARRLRRFVAPLLTLVVLLAIVLPRLPSRPQPAPAPTSAAPPSGPAPPTPAQTAFREAGALFDRFLAAHPGWNTLEEELLSRGLVTAMTDPALELALDLLEPLVAGSPGVDRLAYHEGLMRVLQAMRNRRAHGLLPSLVLAQMAELPREHPATAELLVRACALATTSAREWRTKGINRPVGPFEHITVRLAATEPSAEYAALFRVFQAACIHFRNDRSRTRDLRAILDDVDPASLPKDHRWRHVWVATRDAERFDELERARPLYDLGASLAPSPTVRVFFERREMESKMEVMFGKPPSPPTRPRSR